jgi:hypothetical protein
MADSMKISGSKLLRYRPSRVARIDRPCQSAKGGNTSGERGSRQRDSTVWSRDNASTDPSLNPSLKLLWSACRYLRVLDGSGTHL